MNVEVPARGLVPGHVLALPMGRTETVREVMLTKRFVYVRLLNQKGQAPVKYERDQPVLLEQAEPLPPFGSTALEAAGVEPGTKEGYRVLLQEYLDNMEDICEAGNAPSWAMCADAFGVSLAALKALGMDLTVGSATEEWLD